MKTTIFAIALLVSGAAVAQTYPDTTTTTTDVTADTTMVSTGQVQMPSNADPEHDARGIAVISDPAAVPAGFNGTVAAAVGGPYEPVSGAAASTTPDASYPACSATVTDNCLQTYERGRSPQ